MLDRIRKDEGGFTLIELLVVILIIGILAAIALPSFLGQQDKGKDASAKSNVRNAYTQVESCLSDNSATIAGCVAPANTGLKFITTGTPAPGEVKVTAGSGTVAYTIDGASASTNVFTLTKNTDGTLSYDCTTHGKGSCPSDGKWAG